MNKKVFVELMRRGYIPGQTLFYYQTRNDKECRGGVAELWWGFRSLAYFLYLCREERKKDCKTIYLLSA